MYAVDIYFVTVCGLVTSNMNIINLGTIKIFLVQVQIKLPVNNIDTERNKNEQRIRYTYIFILYQLAVSC